jgi:hypothetical protein
VHSRQIASIDLVPVPTAKSTGPASVRIPGKEFRRCAAMAEENAAAPKPITARSYPM